MPQLSFEKTVSPVLLRRFELEGQYEDGTGQHYGCILQDNRDLVAHNPYSPELAAHQQMWVHDMLKRINRELHHDGAWVAAFTHPRAKTGPAVMLESNVADYLRVCFIFVDKDGDPQFTWDWVSGVLSDLFDFPAVMAAGPDWIVSQLDEAWKLWAMSQQVLDAQEGETFKRAQGQQAPSTRH